MTEQPTEESCIKTRCTVDNTIVMAWLLTMFKNLGHDAKLDEVITNYSGGVHFTVLHTRQPPKPIGPILLDDPNGDVQDG